MSNPAILLIDDAPDTALLPNDVDVTPLDPADDDFGERLTAGIAAADLILLDHNLHLAQTLGLQTLDGASFVGNLRSWARAQGKSLPPLVIYTSEDEAFAKEVPALGPAVPIDGSFIGREARIAPSLDVEWLIAKNAESAVEVLRDLARDCQALKSIAKDDRMDLAEISDYLKVPDAPWSDVASTQLVRWRPPVSEVGNASAGTRGAAPVLRWLLHRVLPCPGLLASDLQAAWSLGIDPDDFQKILDSAEKSDWITELGNCRYIGAGHTLVGRRWWVAGVDFLGWRLRELSYELGGLPAALENLAGAGVRIINEIDAVVVVNSDVEETGLAPMAEAIQIHPPGWPPESPDPWMLRSEVKNDPVAQTMIDREELSVGL